MKKEETIKRYGEAAYEKRLEQNRQWQKANPEKVEERTHNQCWKGGKYYEKNLEYDHSGLQGERSRSRVKHAINWRLYKMIIAPESQIHHERVPESVEYKGVALVETDQHRHGIIDVIRTLEGEINVFTEKELQGGLAI